MALNSIHNCRGFFSDYWFGSVFSAKKREGLTPAEARKLIKRINYLRQIVDTTEPLPITEFRERFARPFLLDVFGYSMLENPDDTYIRKLTKNGEQKVISAVLLEPNHDEIDSRQNKNELNKILLESDLPYGLILTPNVLRLVRRPGDGIKNAYFEFSIILSAEGEDLESLIAAYQILRANSLAVDQNGNRAIDILDEESRKHKARVSDDLKQAVFGSAEILIRGFLEDVEKPNLIDLRDAALTALYRLLFIFYAESRDEKLQTHKLYLDSYSLERLLERLKTLRIAELPANRYSLWSQITALFRIYDQGMPPVPGLHNIPPRGGTLFSEKTKSGVFLASTKLPDRLVADLLSRLATTRPRRGVGRERISFRELEIEQLGAVYEGLLEYEPRIAETLMFGINAQGREFVLPTSELKRLCIQKGIKLSGDINLIEGTEVYELHTDASNGDEDIEEDEGDSGDDNSEEEGEEGLKSGGMAKLLRRYEVGDFYFVPGTARKVSGSYYTREEIVQYLVKNALDDLVKGKDPADIEMLRVIDPACGSGHFLVGAARFLGQKLYESYRRELKENPPPDFYPNKDLTSEIREQWEKDGLAWCKRRIVEKCLFGVDLNPTAVQLAQVALWIESLAGDRPLSFFSHHIRCGNSLLGTWVNRLHEAPHPDYDRKEGQRGLFGMDIDQQISKALDERLLIDSNLPATVRKDTPEEFEYKNDRLERAQKALKNARLLFDLRNSAAFLSAIWAEWEHIMSTHDLEQYAMGRSWWNEFQTILKMERFFHWELEFPEVFMGEKKGFDVVLGNPPWEKVKPDRKEFYGKEDILIRAYKGGELDQRIKELEQASPTLKNEFERYVLNVKTVAACLKGSGDYKFCDWEINERSTGGDPDLFKFFVERGHQILRIGGRLGFLVPSAIYNNEGCTGLRHLMMKVSRVISFYGFENRNKIFNIDSRYKFVCLALEKLRSEVQDSEFNAAFMRHDVEELEKEPPKGVTVIIKKSELERLSPGTLAFLEYRSQRDREIILKMYGLLPGMKKRPLLGDQGEGTWNAKFYREFDMTNDRDLWTKPNGKLWTPKEICGLNWPEDMSIPFSEVRAAMAENGFWPLYEGKHMDQYLIDTKPIDKWVDLEKAKNKNGVYPRSSVKIVFRAVARNTDERTFIVSILPLKSCFGNSCWGAEMPNCDATILMTILNSFVTDYATRFRVSANMNFTHAGKIAVLSPDQCSGMSTIETRSVSNLTINNVADDKDLWSLLWDANKSMALAYGLNAGDFEHIFSAFPVFARKRPKFFAYLQEKIKEWKEE